MVIDKSEEGEIYGYSICGSPRPDEGVGYRGIRNTLVEELFEGTK
jgi:hypothetical protein